MDAEGVLVSGSMCGQNQGSLTQHKPLCVPVSSSTVLGQLHGTGSLCPGVQAFLRVAAPFIAEREAAQLVQLTSCPAPLDLGS